METVRKGYALIIYQLLYKMIWLLCAISAALCHLLTFSTFIDVDALAIQNRRDCMQDELLIMGTIEHFLGVICDGHNRDGKKAADIILSILYQRYVLLPEPLIELKSRHRFFRHAFKKADKFIGKKLNGGSTVVAAYIYTHNNLPHCCFAWVGNSRAILVNHDGSIAQQTIDHQPFAQEEYMRLYKKNTMLSIAPGDIPRIQGLAISRSLGDKKIKKKAGIDVIIARPDFIDCPIKPGQTIVLASDGIWERLGSQQVGAIIQEHVDSLNARTLAGIIKNRAIEAQSSDNISVIVAKLSAHSYGSNNDLC